jgi:hypothetical protein
LEWSLFSVFFEVRTAVDRVGIGERTDQVVDQEFFNEDPIEHSADKETVSTPRQSARSTTSPPDSEEDTINRTSSRGGTADIRSPSPATSIAPSTTPELSLRQRSGKFGKNIGGWDLKANYKPQKAIDSDNIEVLPGRTRGDRKKPDHGSGGSTSNTFYRTFERPEEWNSSFHAFITSTKQHRNDLPHKPENYEEAKKHPLWTQWREAMVVEVKKVREKGTTEMGV